MPSVSSHEFFICREMQFNPIFFKFTEVSLAHHHALHAKHRVKMSNVVSTLIVGLMEAKHFACATKVGHTIPAISQLDASISMNATSNTVHLVDAASKLCARIRLADSRVNAHQVSPEIQQFNVTISTNAQHQIAAAKEHNVSTKPVHSNASVPRVRFPIQIQVCVASQW